MKSFLVFILTITLMALGAAAQPAQARGETIYLVQVGDTLYSIALNHGLSVDELAEANGLAWNGWIYPGQQILIPTPAVGWGNQFDTPFIQPAYGMPRSAGYETPTYAYQPLPNPAYPVQPTGFSTFQNFNSVSWSGGGLNQQPYAVFSPQNAYAYRPPAWSQPLAPTMGLSLATALGEKWIDVNLTNQMVVAYEGQTPVFRAPASTGIWEYPTIAGTFSIYVKYEKTRMTGGSGEDAYDLPDVPYVMYFHGGYGLHGTYWHNNFGTPMSHGCVNLSIRDAEWLFNWAPIGTKVVTHY